MAPSPARAQADRCSHDLFIDRIARLPLGGSKAGGTPLEVVPEEFPAGYFSWNAVNIGTPTDPQIVSYVGPNTSQPGGGCYLYGDVNAQ